MIKALEYNDDSIRIAAVNALGEIKNPDAVMPLLKLLDDIDKEVRISVRNALGENGDEQTTDLLYKYFVNNEGEKVNEKSREMRDLIALLEKRNNFILLLIDTKDSLIKAVVKALGNIGDKKAADALTRLLYYNDTGIVLMTIKALDSIGDWRASSHLRHVMRNSRNEEKIAALEALINLGDSDALNNLVFFIVLDNREYHDYAEKILSNVLERGTGLKGLIYFLLNKRNNSILEFIQTSSELLGF